MLSIPNTISMSVKDKRPIQTSGFETQSMSAIVPFGVAGSVALQIQSVEPTFGS
jgi:hypothetical protein